MISSNFLVWSLTVWGGKNVKLYFSFCRRFLHTFIGRWLTQFSRCLNLAAILLRDRLRVLGHKSPKKTLLRAFPAPVLMKTFLQLFGNFLWKKQCPIRTDKRDKVTVVFLMQNAGTVVMIAKRSLNLMLLASKSYPELIQFWHNPFPNI